AKTDVNRALSVRGVLNHLDVTQSPHTTRKSSTREFEIEISCQLIQNLRPFFWQVTSTARNCMAHVVTSKCVGCKFTDCVEACPVACFYELDNQVIIHPEECIDCTACVALCPVEAIYAESDVPAEFQANTEFNATQA